MQVHRRWRSPFYWVALNIYRCSRRTAAHARSIVLRLRAIQTIAHLAFAMPQGPKSQGPWNHVFRFLGRWQLTKEKIEVFCYIRRE